MKTSAQRVLAATNSWLHSQTRAEPVPLRQGPGLRLHVERDGHQVDHRAHLPRRRRPRLPRAGKALEQLTEDHRVVVSSRAELSRPRPGHQPAARDRLSGARRSSRATSSCWRPTASTSTSTRASSSTTIGSTQATSTAPRTLIVDEAYERGSPDNLTVQIVRVDELPDGEAREIVEQLSELPLPPLLEPRMRLRRLQDRAGDSTPAAAATSIWPSTTRPDARGRSRFRRSTCATTRPTSKRFMMEEWVARRIDSAHVLKPRPQSRKRNYLYVVTEYVEARHWRSG